jgi:uncharacterized RDD family membrane protein YckC
MTATPPPGNYPPPPPGNYPPPGNAGLPGALPPDAYTPWLTRVLAFLIDYAPYALVGGIGYGIEAATQETVCIKDTSGYGIGDVCATGNSTLGVAAIYVSVLVGFAYVIWNLGYKQGTTGSSIGKSILKVKVISEKTGQPLGFGPSVLRQIAHAVDAIPCYVGFLFPLWDAKRQTLADKIMSSIVVPIT